MIADIWTLCHGEKHIGLIKATAWRIVETQEQMASRQLVDSLEEQIILEELLDTGKPAVSENDLAYHPLLYMPFRYPPLKHGSRFGKKTEPALWYGSLALSTAFAEKAFYLFNFLNASSAVLGMVTPQFTGFSVQVQSKKGVQLTSVAFANYTSLISKPTSYQASQMLGSAMRHAGVEVFTYGSAREKQKGVNIGLFTPHAFLHKTPNANSFQSWQCIATTEVIEFSHVSTLVTETMRFTVNQFRVGKVLPFPAC